MDPSRAIVLTIGDELLSGHIVDLNTPVLARLLAAVGIPLIEQRTVGDAAAALRTAVAEAVARAPLVIVSGGLGPTPDDRTRGVLAELAGVPLVESAAVMATLAARAARRRRPLHPESARQAQIPRGAEILDNPVGAAPGLWLPMGRAVVCALPGVPAELAAMCESVLRPRLEALPGRIEMAGHTIRTAAVPESKLMGVLAGLAPRPVQVAYLPQSGNVDLRLAAVGPGAAAAVAAAAAQARELLAAELGPIVYGEGEVELAAVVLDHLRRRGWRLAVAESCTGGLVSKRLTDIPGSSAVLDRGWVTYADAAKEELLGVPAALIAQHGAVSAEVAAAMATGARRAAGVEVGVAVTGIAGPGGGTPAKPVGLVHAAVTSPDVEAGATWHHTTGDRAQIRERTAVLVLDLVRRHLLTAG